MKTPYAARQTEQSLAQMNAEQTSIRHKENSFDQISMEQQEEMIDFNKYIQGMKLVVDRQQQDKAEMDKLKVRDE